MDFARRRAELQAAIDLNAIKAGELAKESSDLQRAFRQNEVEERLHRDRLRKNLNVNPPTGIQK